ncbi:hypothetical protein [Pedobacter frigoris]|uniref:Peptidase M43 pregnancy-associated plasma-A domain-containing protein n=1 Tax=Pedobacter frigoris TaxID=2571272 RepID=A0A4U1CJG1_9SPHI|nr:hypothetical protein [Pedobacter frigoris]TKC07587.1 hypothetical protein FA047_10125 [Pedobacter frigoris]
MKNNLTLLPLLLLLLSTACKKQETQQEPVSAGLSLDNKLAVNAPITTLAYTTDHTYNLNVVYFVPNDVPAVANYQSRLSEILINLQTFYKNEMSRNGYGMKTFGLYKDGANVRIITINGAYGKSQYPYSGGNGAVWSEVQAYKTAHPTEFDSDHYLIILPAYSYNASGEPSGGPFYGTGRVCYALDYNGMAYSALGTGGTAGTRATKWIGGMAHELGHGLNLPHNKGQVYQTTALGTALMGAGNYTYGISPTFLTHADCAILNQNQVFQNSTSITYHGAVTSSLTALTANYNASTQTIQASGSFASTVTVKSVDIYLDPNVNNEGTGGNTDYNAVAFKQDISSGTSFNINMKVSELYEKANTPYQMKIRLICQNGVVKTYNYSFSFVNGVPNINITAP